MDISCVLYNIKASAIWIHGWIFCYSQKEKETDICEELMIGQNVRISFMYHSHYPVCISCCTIHIPVHFLELWQFWRFFLLLCDVLFEWLLMRNNFFSSLSQWAFVELCLVTFFRDEWWLFGDFLQRRMVVVWWHSLETNDGCYMMLFRDELWLLYDTLQRWMMVVRSHPSQMNDCCYLMLFRAEWWFTFQRWLIVVKWCSSEMNGFQMTPFRDDLLLLNDALQRWMVVVWWRPSQMNDGAL